MWGNSVTPAKWGTISTGAITLDPNGVLPSINNNEVIWSQNAFGQLNPPVNSPEGVDVFVFVLPGTYEGATDLVGFTGFNIFGLCSGIIIFTGTAPEYYQRPYVLAHEIGHFFLGPNADVSPAADESNLMISGGSGAAAPNAGKVKELRYLQWNVINPHE